MATVPLDTVRALLAADVPVLVWGPPGTAKTASFLALAEAEGAYAETLIGSTLDPSDVGGTPVPFQGNVVLAPPGWVVRLRAALDRGQPAWLFLDELSCAPPAVQAALLRVVQEREVAGVALRGVRVVAAANPADSAADGGWLSPAMSNRFAHVKWETPASWGTGLLTQWGKGWPDAGRTAANLAAYLQANPKEREGAASADGSGGYPTPRSWTAAVRTLAASGGVQGAHARAIVGACVGSAAADEWLTWVAAQDLPDPEDMLAQRVPLPKRPDQVRASLLAVAAAALAPHAEQSVRMGQAWALIGTVRPDLAVAAATALLDGAPDAPLPAFVGQLAQTIQSARARAGL